MGDADPLCAGLDPGRLHLSGEFRPAADGQQRVCPSIEGRSLQPHPGQGSSHGNGAEDETCGQDAGPPTPGSGLGCGCGGGGQGEGREDRRRPVGLHAVVQGVEGQVEAEGQGGQKGQGKVHPASLSAVPDSGPDPGAGQNRDERIEQDELCREELAKVSGPELRGLDPSELLFEGQPVVRCVPGQVGGEDRAGGGHGRPGPGRQQAPASLRGADQPQEDARRQEEGRVL